MYFTVERLHMYLFLMQHVYFKDAIDDHIIMYITIMNIFIVIVSISTHLISCSPLMLLSIKSVCTYDSQRKKLH